MLVGTAKIEITPPAGTWLVGYLDREDVSTTIATPLFARALALRAGGKTFVLISCELLAVHDRLVAEVRSLVATAAADDQMVVWIAATHTHSGPPSYATSAINEIERRYIEGLPRRIADAALQALAALEPATIALGRTSTAIGANRRRIVDGAAIMEPAAGRPLDSDVSVLEFRHADGSRKALLVVTATHPVTVGRDNLTVNGDYPGELCRRLESELGGTVLFALGAGGDVNPVDGLQPEMDAARRTAALLASDVHRAIAASSPLSDTELAVTGRRAEFPVSPSRIDRGEGQTPHIEHLVQLRGLDWPAIESAMDRRHPWAPPAAGSFRLQSHVPGEIGALRIGTMTLIAMPFELFSAVGLELKRRLPSGTAIVIGQTNGALGYLAPADEHPYGGYEIDESSLFYRTRGPLGPAATAQAIQIGLDLAGDIA